MSLFSGCYIIQTTYIWFTAIGACCLTSTHYTAQTLSSTRDTNWICPSMPEGQLDTLRGETSRRVLQICFFSLLWSLNCQSKSTGPEKKKSCGTVILCCGKGNNSIASPHSLLYYAMLGEKTSLMVTVNQQLEKS